MKRYPHRIDVVGNCDGDCWVTGCMIFMNEIEAPNITKWLDKYLMSVFIDVTWEVEWSLVLLKAFHSRCVQLSLDKIDVEQFLGVYDLIRNVSQIKKVPAAIVPLINPSHFPSLYLMEIIKLPQYFPHCLFQALSHLSLQAFHGKETGTFTCDVLQHQSKLKTLQIVYPVPGPNIEEPSYNASGTCSSVQISARGEPRNVREWVDCTKCVFECVSSHVLHNDLQRNYPLLRTHFLLGMVNNHDERRIALTQSSGNE